MNMFYYDEEQNGFIAEINSVRFICEEVKDEYGELAKELADSYEDKLSEIIDYVLPEVTTMFGSISKAELERALGIPQIDLDREVISYLEQTLDDMHIIEVEFGGLFDEFFEVIIDG